MKCIHDLAFMLIMIASWMHGAVAMATASAAAAVTVLGVAMGTLVALLVAG